MIGVQSRPVIFPRHPPYWDKTSVAHISNGNLKHGVHVSAFMSRKTSLHLYATRPQDRSQIGVLGYSSDRKKWLNFPSPDLVMLNISFIALILVFKHGITSEGFFYPFL